MESRILKTWSVHIEAIKLQKMQNLFENHSKIVF